MSMTNAQRVKKCHDKKRDRGLVHFQRWVTKAQAVELDKRLAEMWLMDKTNMGGRP